MKFSLGAYAMFSTGSGLIPSALVEFIVEYRDINIPNAQPGSNPWVKVANAGLTVYDICNSDSYDKQIDASGLIKDSILEQFRSLPGFLLFNGDFECTDKILDL